MRTLTVELTIPAHIKPGAESGFVADVLQRLAGNMECGALYREAPHVGPDGAGFDHCRDSRGEVCGTWRADNTDGN